MVVQSSNYFLYEQYYRSRCARRVAVSDAETNSSSSSCYFGCRHVTKTNMAEGIQKRLQSEIEKYKAVQKGIKAEIVYLSPYEF